MPNREFLETYPLYRKFNFKVPESMNRMATPAIHMYCRNCDSVQTFNSEMEHDIGRIEGDVTLFMYICTSCKNFERFFMIKFDFASNYMMKVGQEPPWDITLDRNLEKMLGERADYYKKGIICESQSYGIAAFAYYRRIVEEIIDELLTEIEGLLTGKEKELYAEALEKTRQTTITQEKIELVKDLLPPILRPNGMNPLSTLHSILSQGLHGETDEQCIELAMNVREILLFLVNQVTTGKVAVRHFTESMRKLLDKKSK